MQNSFTWSEDFNGRGAWEWNYYSTLSSEGSLWRQIDWPFGFTYPGAAPLSETKAWEIEEHMDRVSLNSDETVVSFMLPIPKWTDEDRDLKSYCQQHINGSNQTVTFEEAVTIGGKSAYWVEYDSSDADLKGWSGTNLQQEGFAVCVDLEDSWMDIYASQTIDEAEFKNILGSLSFDVPAEDVEE